MNDKFNDIIDNKIKTALKAKGLNFKGHEKGIPEDEQLWGWEGIYLLKLS